VIDERRSARYRWHALKGDGMAASARRDGVIALEVMSALAKGACECTLVVVSGKGRATTRNDPAAPKHPKRHIHAAQHMLLAALALCGACALTSARVLSLSRSRARLQAPGVKCQVCAGWGWGSHRWHVATRMWSCMPCRDRKYIIHNKIHNKINTYNK
jgi:hypothetical protein